MCVRETDRAPGWIWLQLWSYFIEDWWTLTITLMANAMLAPCSIVLSFNTTNYGEASCVSVTYEWQMTNDHRSKNNMLVTATGTITTTR